MTFNLSKKELAILRRLNSPIKIQNFLDKFPINYEKHGETYMSPRRVLKAKKMHCMEGAVLAAAALWFHGEEPLLLDLKIKPGGRGHLAEDHVVALYKRNGYWGAISKTNHATLRFRDPIYKNLRELALSYFHEYFLDKKGNKVLRGYSAPMNLKNFGLNKIGISKSGISKKRKAGWWITAEENLDDMVQALDNSRHFSILPKNSEKYLRRADKMEIKAGELREWSKADPRTH